MTRELKLTTFRANIIIQGTMGNEPSTKTTSTEATSTVIPAKDAFRVDCFDDKSPTRKTHSRYIPYASSVFHTIQQKAYH